MTFLNPTVLAVSMSIAAVPALADAGMVDALAEKALGNVLSAKMDSDANSHLYNIPVGELGVIDRSLGAHDADYEVVLASRGQAVGAAVYGQNDADYDAFLTPANFFETAALGQHDAGYEIVLAGRGQLIGAAIYGQNDADYDAFLTPANFFATAALGAYDADYEVVLEARQPFGSDFFDQNQNVAILNN